METKDKLREFLLYLLAGACIGVHLVLLTLLLSGCSSTRKTAVSEAVKVKEHVQTETSQDLTATSLDLLRDSLRQHIAENYEVEIRRTEYDNTKPPDSTGRPPMKNEEFITLRAKRDTHTVSGLEREKADSVASSTRENTGRDIKTDRQTKIKTTEKKRLPWPLWLAGLAIGAGIVYLLYKLKQGKR